MKTLGNVLWIILGGGIFIFLEYLIGGLILCLTIIGIPFGLQAFKLAGLALTPFGREVVQTRQTGGCLSTIMNIVWILVGGIWVALTHAIFALLLAITIIGIPFARQHMKLAVLSFTPFGYEIRRIAQGKQL
ncbi:YccF domain-containing protein [Cesiribacter sp. SM1]|uniref:YccF domain-containing protein n=1 Tax=Cesiribacter sp. SM1 TaxID=2861196 RepID=UPI001CD615DF|nr:YccF domain-containing protein [Cesiribacter sp. SM1]